MPGFALPRLQAAPFTSDHTAPPEYREVAHFFPQIR